MLNLFHFLFISLGINIALFIPAFIFKTDKLTDLSYSLSFASVIITAFLLNQYTQLNFIVTLLIVVWAARLGGFLFLRINKMKKDKRFDGIREKFFSFFGFWMTQAVTVWVVLIPAILFMQQSKQQIWWVGAAVWAFGILLEATADAQKYNFKQNKKNKDKFIQTGVWKYSRHPNFFGEIMCWTGIYLLVFMSFNTTFKLIALVSPLMISSILIFFSGLPPLEKYADKKWGKDKDYKEYKRRTSILIPWFPKN
jgi:steroid 5-alpha reductase family enzyme